LVGVGFRYGPATVELWITRLPACPAFLGAVSARMIIRTRSTLEAVMLLRIAGLLLLGAVTLATSAVGQSTPPPPAIARTVIAATKLPTVTEVSLYFRVVSATIPADAASDLSAADGILYQLSGSTEIVVDNQARDAEPR
jgi:hypothetical protein